MSLQTFLILGGCAVVALGLSLCFFALLGASERFAQRCREAQRTEEDYQRARWLWRKTLGNCGVRNAECGLKTDTGKERAA